MSDSTTVEIYKKPEVKVAISLLKDPTPNRILFNYLKTTAASTLQKQSSIYDRPIDSFKGVANEGIGAGGAALGYRLAGMLSGGLGPKGTAIARIAGGIAGRWAAMSAGDVALDLAEQAAERSGVLPESLTHLDITSANQATGAAIGNLAGMMSAVPIAVGAVKSGVPALAAIPSSLITGALVARVGQGVGNMLGGYIDRRNANALTLRTPPEVPL